MRYILALFALWLAACTPTYLGSVPYYPYNLDDFPVFTSPAGQPLYGLRRYEERRWTAVARRPVGVFDFSITLNWGPVVAQASFPQPCGDLPLWWERRTTRRGTPGAARGPARF